MAIELIAVPYVLGREGVGMGAGPLALEAGAAEGLGAERVVRIGLSAPFTNEIGACFDLNRQVAHAVAGARERGAVPVVLTGNCHTQQAVVAGLGADGLRSSGSIAMWRARRARGRARHRARRAPAARCLRRDRARTE